MSASSFILWALSSLFVAWRICHLMSLTGEVDNVGRVIILVGLLPVLSVILALCIVFTEVILWLDRWWYSPKMVTWRLERKTRKRRCGPIVRIVQYMHNKRKEKKASKESES